MADVVTSQLLHNDPRNVVYLFTNLSDGTGETAVKKVDASSSGPLGVTVQGQVFYPQTHLVVRDIQYDVRGMTLQLLWEASANVPMLYLTGFGTLKFSDRRGGFQGLVNP